MNRDDIEKQLNTFIEWEKPKREKQDSNLVSNQKRIRRQLLDLGHDEEDIDRVMAEMQEDSRVIVDGVNITVPKKILRVRHEPKVCELGCGKIAVDQKIDISFQTYPIKHWRKKCNFCQYYQMPDGTFARNSQQYQTFLLKKKRDQTK